MTGSRNERAMRRCHARMFYDEPHGSLAGRWVPCKLEQGHRGLHEGFHPAYQGAGIQWTKERAIHDERRVARLEGRHPPNPLEERPTYRPHPRVSFDESTDLGCWRAWLTNDHHQLRSRLAHVERQLEKLIAEIEEPPADLRDQEIAD